MLSLLRLLACGLLLLPFGLIAQATAEETDTSTFDLEYSDEELLAFYQAYADSLEGTLTFYADTTLRIGDGLAELAIPPGYRFLNAEDAQTVLVDLWGNPPESADETMGMLFPNKYRPSDDDAYGVDIYFTADGYIEDDDAEGMDYDDMLAELQADTEAANEFRRESGYEAVELIGWATPPHYDAANKRLHWAKELSFEGNEDHTLNYHILFLGRRGYLTMNVIGNMEDLDEISSDLNDFLGSIAYQEGHRYTDFDPSMDEVAAYGIGALIAGKVLAKTGLLAGLGLFLAKAWKLLVFGGLALWAGIKRFVGNGE